MIYAVIQATEVWAGDANVVAEVVREAAAGLVAVIDRRKQSAKKQQKSVRILVASVDRLDHDICRVAADFAHRARTLQHESILADDSETHFLMTHVVKREGLIEKADEGPDRAGRIVVLCLAK